MLDLFNWNKLFFPVGKTIKTYIMAPLLLNSSLRNVQSKNVDSLFSTIIVVDIYTMCSYKNLNILCSFTEVGFVNL